eukprot:11263845-Ditylum_brightwellii.AAC.1
MEHTNTSETKGKLFFIVKKRMSRQPPPFLTIPSKSYTNVWYQTTSALIMYPSQGMLIPVQLKPLDHTLLS